MRQKYPLMAGLLFALFLYSAVSASASQDMTFKEYLNNASNHIKANRHFSAVDALKEATRLGGVKHPSLHMRLAFIYYGLGLIPDAIAEGEKAVSLVPASKWYKYDLAKFYLVDRQLDNAERELTALLNLDPGFTLGYYYLSEVYFRQKQYDMAWLSLTRARLLGHQGKHLSNKLSPLTSKPAEHFDSLSDTDILFRFINLSTDEEAKAVLDRIKDGKPFHNIELELKTDTSIKADFGVFMLSDLKDSLVATLKDSVPYTTPIIIQTGPNFRVIQRIVPFNPQAWQTIASNSPAGPGEKDLQKTNIYRSYILQEAAAEGGSPIPETSQSEANEKTGDYFFSRMTAFYTLDTWKNAWKNGNLEAYFSAYSIDFIPSGNVSLARWKKNRTKSLSYPQNIHIELVNPVVEMLEQTRVTITFKQIYKTEIYRDTVIKRLTMTKEVEKWKIIKEQVIQTLIE